MTDSGFAEDAQYSEPMTDQQAWVIIPAAGVGQRMQADRPKQYLMLQGQTVLERTLRRFKGLPWVKGIVVALHPQDPYYQKLPEAVRQSVIAVEGGNSRQSSVQKALTSIQTLAGDNDWVMVHDAARACIHSRQLTDFFVQATECEHGAILALPMSDTLKKIEQGTVVTRDRSLYWRAQTPQQFRYQVLIKALNLAEDMTDEASAIEQLGLQYQLIEGFDSNIKITRPMDLVLANALIGQEGDDPCSE